jgi:hypothetical protein
MHTAPPPLQEWTDKITLTTRVQLRDALGKRCKLCGIELFEEVEKLHYGAGGADTALTAPPAGNGG